MTPVCEYKKEAFVDVFVCCLEATSSEASYIWWGRLNDSIFGLELNQDSKIPLPCQQVAPGMPWVEDQVGPPQKPSPTPNP